MPKRTDIKSVMVIGSGPIVIGQAAEFDYAGAQACRVLHDAGVNPPIRSQNRSKRKAVSCGPEHASG